MKRPPVLLVVLGAVLWGTDSLFRRLLSEHLSPVTIVFLEHCILVAAMLPWLMRRRTRLMRLSPRDWYALAFIAVGGSVAATSLHYWAR
jgi:drug/metabolite transporter (DMT)-like permease